MVEVCVPIPKAPASISIPLPFGGSLRSIADISQGPPTDCALAHSLMLQLAPFMANLTCIIRMLKVINDLKEVITDKVPFINAGAVPTLLGDIGALAQCFNMVLDPCSLVRMVKGIVAIIMSYLGCVLEMLSSILNFSVGIDLNSAEGNPVLLANLQCAQDNMNTAMQGVTNTMEGIIPLIEMMNILLEIAQKDPIEVPSLAFATPTAGSLLEEDPLAPLRAVRDSLQNVYNILDTACPG